MGGLFQVLEIGKRALLSQQINLQTIGHNISNVNTPGYTRQRVSMSTSFPEQSLIGPLGSGVTVTGVRQIRDLFLGDQFRRESKSLGQWAYKDKIFSQIEALFNEPNDNTLSDQLNKFWGSWLELSSSDVDTVESARVAVLSQATALVNSFNQLANQLDALRTSTNNDMVAIIKNVNVLSKEIARLNEFIVRQEAGGSSANDLRDARDILIDELSTLVDINTVNKANGANIVYIGAMAIIDGSDAIAIETEMINENGTPTNRLVWKGTSIGLTNLNGQLRGLTVSRDEIIPGFRQQLDELARALITEVNALHRTGYGQNNATGYDFFDTQFTDAGRIRINQQIALDPSLIATASAVESPGDKSLALAINDLRNKKVLNGNSITINDFYNSLIGKLGVETNEARSTTSNYVLLVNQIDNARMSVQGVSLDEEMANLIQAQHAYDAAARVITTIDQALDTVILGMGIVGR